MSFDSTATVIGWLIADAMAEEDRIEEIDHVLIRKSHPDTRVRGTLQESIVITEEREVEAEPALTVFAGWLGTVMRDYRFDGALLAQLSVEECMTGYRASELMCIRDVVEWSAHVDLDDRSEDVRFVGLLARACVHEEGLSAVSKSVKNLVERGMFRAADALLAASLLREVQLDDDKDLNIVAFVEYRALLPSEERLYIDRAIAALDNGNWSERGKLLKNGFSRFVRVGSTPRLNETELSSHDLTVRRYLKDAARQLDRAEQGEEEAAGHCILQVAKAAETYLNVGKRTLKGKNFAGKLMLGSLLRELKEAAKKADAEGATDKHWYQRLFNDRALSMALDSLNGLRSAAAHHSPQKVAASDARSHWHTWVAEGQLLRLREIVDGA